MTQLFGQSDEVTTSVTDKDYIVEDRKDGKGFGVYALKHYASGELIALVDGEIITEPHLRSTF